MKLPRRKFLHLAAGAVVLPAASRLAIAQTYPIRPVRVVVGFAAGGSVDIMARVIGQWLSERLGRQFVIENRPGAGTNIATDSVAKASPDGYTLLLATTSNAINATLNDTLNFNFIRDIVPVAGLVSIPYVMVANPSIPAKTVSEFIAYAKANPGKLHFASSGNGASSHVAGELFKMMAGIDLLHVPYRSSPLPDLLGGRVQIYFSPIPSSIEYIRAGKLRALAVTSGTREKALPDVPTVAEFVPDFEASNWTGVGAPKGIPIEIVEKLNKEINAGFVDAKLRARFADLGGTVLPGSSADFGKLIADDTEKWATVIRRANIKPE
jgi:tripartite-type tricarboxylate transporter receptor subunit TctC